MKLKPGYKLIQLPNGDSFMARIKPNLADLTPEQLADRDEMKLRRRKDYIAFKKTVELMDQGVHYGAAARTAGLKVETARCIFRNRIFLKKYGLKRRLYQWRIKAGKPVPNMPQPAKPAQAPA